MPDEQITSGNGSLRGRPVIRRIEAHEVMDPEALINGYVARDLAADGKLWLFCGEYDGREGEAVDAADRQTGHGIFKAFAPGSWPGGHLRD